MEGMGGREGRRAGGMMVEHIFSIWEGGRGGNKW